MRTWLWCFDKDTVLGSVVEYRCVACSFSSGELRLGWGKSGRSSFWGGLVRCDPCGELGVMDIAASRASTDRELHCANCRGLLTLIEGTSVSVPCPRCRATLRYETVGTWSWSVDSSASTAPAASPEGSTATLPKDVPSEGSRLVNPQNRVSPRVLLVDCNAWIESDVGRQRMTMPKDSNSVLTFTLTVTVH